MALQQRINKTFRYRKRGDNIILRVIIAASLLLFTLLGGIIGYMIIEGFTLIEALYMTMITASTVGFGEVNQLSTTGRVFTMILIAFAFLTLAYAVSTLSTFVIEGGFKKVRKEYKNMKKLESIENHVIIAGYGRYGHQVHETLEKNNIPVVIIEIDEDRLLDIREENTTPYIQGDASQDETLERARIEHARALVVTLSDDAENIYVCLSARQFKNDLRIISRAIDGRIEKKLKRAGANFVVKPEKSGGLHMATLVLNPNSLEFIELLGNMGIHVEDIACQRLSDIIGKSIRDIDLRGRTGVHLIGLRNKDGEYNVNPGPDVIMNESDHLIVIGNNSQITNFVKTLS